MVHSSANRLALLQAGCLTINQCRIPLHADNPERVLIKDLPLWVSDDLIKEYISSQAQIKSNGFVYKSKARNNITSGSSSFDNGDRFFLYSPKH